MAPYTNGIHPVSQSNGIPQPNGIHHETNGEPSTKNPNSYSAKYQLADHFIGGNRLDAAPAGVVKDFVLNHDGHTVISNVGSPL